MAFRVGDRIKEGTSSTGTGSFVLTGALAGFQPFSSIPSIAAGDKTWYCAVSGSAWEEGIGTYSSSTSLARTVLKSSNANALVSFSTAPLVYCTIPAAMFPPAGFGMVDAASSSSQGPLTTDVWTKLALNTTAYDADGVWDAVNNKIILPAGGVYSLALRLVRSDSTTSARVEAAMWKNGAQSSNIMDITGAWGTMQQESRFKFVAGDTVEVYIQPVGYSGLTISSSHLVVTMLRAM